MDERYRFSIDCASPVGAWTVLSDGTAVVGIYLAGQRHRPALPQNLSADAVCKKAARQLAEYFAGDRGRIRPAARAAGTDFERCVWNALLEIPFGVTWSYGQLARHIGSPNAARAVAPPMGRIRLAW